MGFRYKFDWNETIQPWYDSVSLFYIAHLRENINFFN
jgi:hypothetical protein